MRIKISFITSHLYNIFIKFYFFFSIWNFIHRAIKNKYNSMRLISNIRFSDSLFDISGKEFIIILPKFPKKICISKRSLFYKWFIFNFTLNNKIKLGHLHFIHPYLATGIMNYHVIILLFFFIFIFRFNHILIIYTIVSFFDRESSVMCCSFILILLFYFQ